MPQGQIFDIHSHMGFFGRTIYGSDDVLRRMDRNGIERAFVCTFITGMIDREDFRRANDFIIDGVRAHPDRFVGQCTLSPVHGSFASEEFRRCLDRGLSGVKMHPDKHGRYSLTSGHGANAAAIDEAMAKLMQEVEAAGSFVYVHSDFNSKVCSPREIVGLAQAFPRAKVILGHFGMDQDLAGLVPSIVKDTPNVYLDSSQTTDNPEAIFVSSTKQLGPDRVLFGSDGPVFSPEVNIKKLEVAVELFQLPATTARAILWDNAIRFLSGVPNVKA
jgi:uncharacterized protein